MATKGSKKTLADILKCSLCLKRYDETDRVPKALPCLHTFCLPCLEGLFETAAGAEVGDRCPTCARDVPLPDNAARHLPTNVTLQDLCAMDWIQRQLDHESLPMPPSSYPCEELTDAPRTTSEDKPSTGDAKETYECRKHPTKTLIMLCTRCFEGLCTECVKSLVKGGHTCTHYDVNFGQTFPGQNKSPVPNIDIDDIESGLAKFRDVLEKYKDMQALVCETRLQYATKAIEKENSAFHEIDGKAAEAIRKVEAWRDDSKAEITRKMPSMNKSFEDELVSLGERATEIEKKLKPIKEASSADVMSAMKEMPPVLKDMKEFEKSRTELSQGLRISVGVGLQCNVDLGRSSVEYSQTFGLFGSARSAFSFGSASNVGIFGSRT